MILNFLANSNLSPRDLIYFCIFGGVVSVIMYISYVVFLKGNID
jgi:hypothetical protein